MKSVNLNLSSEFPPNHFSFGFLPFLNEIFAGLKQIHFGQSEIWRPDIQLYNNADSANMQVLVVFIIITIIIGMIITIIITIT